MNAPDPWAAITDVLAEELAPLTQAQIDARANEYQREQIASAQSDEAMAANLKEYSHG